MALEIEVAELRNVIENLDITLRTLIKTYQQNQKAASAQAEDSEPDPFAKPAQEPAPKAKSKPKAEPKQEPKAAPEAKAKAEEENKPTQDDVRAAAMLLVEAKGRNAVADVLTEFGYKNLTGVKEDDFSSVIAALKEAS